MRRRDSAARRSGTWHTIRRLAVRAVLVLLALLAAGAVYQWLSVRGEAGRFPAAGTLVDVGGRRLHVVCLGTSRPGVPTVLFESSGFGSALSSRTAREQVAAQTRVCSYDRAGTGWSDPGPAVMPTSVLADDLTRLLDRAAIPPPYLIVTSSIGGLTTELFARRHPGQVAGLVFLDAANSDNLEGRAAWLSRTNIALVCSARWAARVGILRLADPFHFRRAASATEGSRAIAHMYTTARMTSLCQLAGGLPQGLQELRGAPPLSQDLPLTVLTAGSSDDLLPPGLAFLRSRVDGWRGAWLTGQERFARRSRRGTWRVVPGSGHLIASSQPQAVVEAIAEMLTQTRR